MENVAGRLRAVVDRTEPLLAAISEEASRAPRGAGKWSLKEILGHLIDSASNNHQRIVRMQLQRDIGAFGYQQQQWNAAQKYQLEQWTGLVELWASYNTHLAHLIEHV